MYFVTVPRVISVEKGTTRSTSFVTVLQYPTSHSCLTRHATDGLAHPTVGPQIKRRGPRRCCSQSSAMVGETLQGSRRIMTSILHAPKKRDIVGMRPGTPDPESPSLITNLWYGARIREDMSICRSVHWSMTGVSEKLGARISRTRYAFEQVCAPAPALGAIVSSRTPAVL